MEQWQNAEEEVDTSKDRNRDNYFRCKHCGILWHHNQCILDGVLDDIKGYQCPDGCVETFNQPPYESPLSQ